MKNKSGIGEMLKNAGILFAITLIAGLALGFVFELTKEPIAYQKELKIQKACAAVFADAASFEGVRLPLPEGYEYDPASSIAVEIPGLSDALEQKWEPFIRHWMQMVRY